MSDQHKTDTAAAMIENAIRLAIESGRDLLAGNTKQALSTCGACLAQLYAFEAMRQKTSGLPVLHEWKAVWASATRTPRHSFYATAMQRSNN